jgi:hypothetical protein
LLSDWFPATTGEIVHVDGGAHAVALAPASQPAENGATDPADPTGTTGPTGDEVAAS